MKQELYEKPSRKSIRELSISSSPVKGGWLGSAMVLGKLPVPGRLTNLDHSKGQGPTVLAVGAVGDRLNIFFSPLSFLSSFSLSPGDCLI